MIDQELALTSPQNQSSLLLARKQIMEKVKTIYSLYGEIKELTELANDYAYPNTREILESSPEIVMQKIDFYFWQKIFEITGIEKVMTRNKWAELSSEWKEKCPVFEEDILLQIFDQLKGVYSSGIKNTIVEVFEGIRQSYYWTDSKIKKSAEFKIPKRIRTRFSYHWEAFSKRMTRSFYSKGIDFQDIETACALLDGKPRPEYPNRFVDKMDESFKQKSIGVEVCNEYFSVRFFKNGNQILTFLRDDIRKSLNMYGSNHREIPKN